jgi:hypothetical protein
MRKQAHSVALGDRLTKGRETSAVTNITRLIGTDGREAHGFLKFSLENGGAVIIASNDWVQDDPRPLWPVAVVLTGCALGAVLALWP